MAVYCSPQAPEGISQLKPLVVVIVLVCSLVVCQFRYLGLCMFCVSVLMLLSVGPPRDL